MKEWTNTQEILQFEKLMEEFRNTLIWGSPIEWADNRTPIQKIIDFLKNSSRK